MPQVIRTTNDLIVNALYLTGELGVGESPDAFMLSTGIELINEPVYAGFYLYILNASLSFDEIFSLSHNGSITSASAPQPKTIEINS